MSILLHGDCIEMMKLLADNSVDMVLTDPPYDIKNTKAGNSRLQKSLNSFNDELTDAAITKGFDYNGLRPTRSPLIIINMSVILNIVFTFAKVDDVCPPTAWMDRRCTERR